MNHAYEKEVPLEFSATATGPKVTDGARRVAEVEAAFLEQVEKYLGL